MFTVVSPLGLECSEKYYGHEVIMKQCTGYAILNQTIYAFTHSSEPGTIMQEISEVVKYCKIATNFSLTSI